MTEAAEHPDVTEISDLTEGLLTPARSEDVRRHLESCADCRDTYESLEEIRGLLGTLPPSTPMPVDVAERIDAALAAEVLLAATAPDASSGASTAGHVAANAHTEDDTTAVVGAETDRDDESVSHRVGAHVSRETSKGSTADRPAGHSRGATGPGRGGRSRSRRRIAGLGAVFTVGALALGGLIFQVAGNDDKTTTSARSGISDENLEARVGKLLTEQQGGASPDSRRESPSFDVKSSPDDAPSPRPLQKKAPPVPSCIEKGIGRKDAPLAVEQDRYQDKPVYLVVLPHPSDPKQVSAYVVDASCTGNNKAEVGEVLSSQSYARR